MGKENNLSSPTLKPLLFSLTPSPPPPLSMEQSKTGCTLLNQILAQSLLLLIDGSSWYYCHAMAVTKGSDTQPVFQLTKSVPVDTPQANMMAGWGARNIIGRL